MAFIQMNNRMFLAIITVVGYDYILTFSDEVGYIWNQPWTRVSTLFVFARYFGLFNLIIYSLAGTSFLPGPAKYVLIPIFYLSVNLLSNLSSLNSCKILYICSELAGLMFLSAAESIMILRVWALYNRSRLILYSLMMLFAIEAISFLTWCIMAGSYRLSMVVVTVPVPDFSFCVMDIEDSALTWAKIVISTQIALGAAMCLLIGNKFIGEALETFKCTKPFRLGYYTILFVREGVVYFLATLFTSILNLLYDTNIVSLEDGWWRLFVVVLFAPTYTLVPRFILNLRALYARSLQGRQGSDIDTSFGLLSGIVGSTIMFADGVPNEWSEQEEELEMVEPAGRSHASASDTIA